MSSLVFNIILTRNHFIYRGLLKAFWFTMRYYLGR
jgi:hypothetical protein